MQTVRTSKAASGDLPEEFDMERSGVGLGLVVVGMYLLSGALFAFATAGWPIFMPDPLDVVAALLRLIGDPGGMYLAAGELGLLGSACIYAGFANVVNRRDGAK